MSSAAISLEAGRTSPTVSPSERRFGFTTRAGCTTRARAVEAAARESPRVQPNARRSIMTAYCSDEADEGQSFGCFEGQSCCSLFLYKEEKWGSVFGSMVFSTNCGSTVRRKNHRTED